MANVRDVTINERRGQRQVLSVPFRMVAVGRSGDVIDGETIDVSPNGMGIRFTQTGKGVDKFLEQLVEESLPIEITLRLPQGSVSGEGIVMWWGLLGSEATFNVRAGILLQESWSDSDWKLIAQNFSDS